MKNPKTLLLIALSGLLLFALLLTAYQMKSNKYECESKEAEYKQALALLTARYTSLDSMCAYNERRLQAIKYTYCTLLEGKYQYTPAITASWQQFNGLTEYVMNYYPKKLTRCTCDSILNSHNRISDLNAELLIQNNPYGQSN